MTAIAQRNAMPLTPVPSLSWQALRPIVPPNVRTLPLIPAILGMAAVRQAAGEDLSTPEMDVFEFEEDEEAEDTEEGAEASEEAAEEEA